VPQNESSLSWNRKKLFKKIVFFFVLAVILSALVLGVWAFIKGDYFKINEIKVSGTRMISPEETIALVNGEEGKRGGLLAFILPDNHMLAYKDNEDLINLIKSHFPRAKDVVINHDYKERLISIAILERTEKTIWCFVPESNEEKRCFWLDNEGLMIGEAPYAEGSLVTIIEDKTGRKISLGERAFPEKELGYLLEVAKMIKEFNWATDEISVSDPLFKEAVVLLSSGQKTMVSLERSSVSEGKAIINAIVSSGCWPKTEYVDLRVEGKGFYKLR
jgi:hypothetical protein